MKIFVNPSRALWNEITARPVTDDSQLQPMVKAILDDVKASGDEAIRKYISKFDGVDLDEFRVSTDEFAGAVQQVDENLKKAIQLAMKNISNFHSQQKETLSKIETMPGVTCWRKSVAIEKVGLYIPGGTAPLFSTLLMLGVPATIAGCSEIVVCTPPGRDGKVNPVILYVASLLGLSTVYRIGGVQAIAAMAYGTQTVSKVSKIFGPGNQYVTCAKQLVSVQDVAIDMPAGPSELAVYIDESGTPAFVAADLLSQAEHGTDSQVLLVASNAGLVEQVQQEIEKQIAELPRKGIAAAALANSKAVVIDDTSTAFDLLNEYAPEHLMIASDEALLLAEKVVNAGSVFLGHYSPETVGDYASGTNHTLPTNGFAKAYSGVSLDSFVRKITFQQVSKKGLEQLGPAVETMAAAEGLMAHRQAVTIRLKQVNK